MKAAAAIRRDINPAGLLSGRSLRNEKSERASRGKRITSRGIDNTEEIMDEMAIHITKYAIFLLLSSLLDRNEETKKRKRPNKIRNLSTVVRSSGPTKSNPPAALGLKDR